MFIELLPPRTSPCVSLPIKEENEDDFPHGELLSIKEEYEYDDIKKEYEYDNTKEYSIKEEYEYDDTKKSTSTTIEKNIQQKM